MAKAKPISDEQIASICRSEIDSASGKAAGEISHERAVGSLLVKSWKRLSGYCRH